MMKNKLLALYKDESGATAVEYGLIAGVMAAILVAALGLFGDKLKDLFGVIADEIGKATDDIKKEE
ncbi:Flp family type IVb pilin [Desulfobulbus elongatus]|uniref:Flp family type IVb pilin n=1 Tax=Desulfobulbus elongatus TaxID=53332 RepID=UPI00054EA8D2|nr:Flp family type IVb pilin [Desulfobulbus elongatus]